MKIYCDVWTEVNKLVDSRELMLLGFKAFIPENNLFKKGFKREFPDSKSISEIVGDLPSESRSTLLSVRRGFENYVPSDKVEYTFCTQFIPRHLYIINFGLIITPIIPKAPRCFNYQIFSHVSYQCRSTAPVCSH